MSNRVAVKELQTNLNKERNVGKGKDTQPPTAPTNLVAAATSHSTVALTWTGSTDNKRVRGYQIFRDGSIVDFVTETHYVEVGLSESTEFSYQVAAYDQAGNLSSKSNTATVTTAAAPVPPPPDPEPDPGEPVPLPPPAPPTDLAATAVSDTSVRLTWKAPTVTSGIVGYRVLRGGSLVARVESLAHTDSGLQPATPYTYTVEAYDANNNTSDPAGPVSTITSAAPGAPSSYAALLPAILVVPQRRSSSEVTSTVDVRFDQYEHQIFDAQKAKLPPDGTSVFNDMMHYDGALGRWLMAARKGESLTTSDLGKRALFILDVGLAHKTRNWPGGNVGVPGAEHNTSLGSIAALYRLNGDERAKAVIWVSAAGSTRDPNGFLGMTRTLGSNARMPAVAQEALIHAHLLNFEHRKPSEYNSSMGFTNRGSWADAIEWLLDLYAPRVQSNGAVVPVVPDADGSEKFWMSAMLAYSNFLCAAHGVHATRCLELGIKITRRCKDALPAGAECLPYAVERLTEDPFKPAYDLAAFHVWTSLVAWQETGETSFRDYALLNINAARKAWVVGAKQFNQTNSKMLLQLAPTLLAGKNWRG